MCGIAGFVYQDTSRDPSGTVREMIAVQKHRGPDGEGFYVSPGAALGHCRLAILDLSDAGHQPMPDPQKRLWLTFNGEIYNYLELADELRHLGHRFQSKCDTEVLLAAYREWGAECLKRLRGMFAFAIWDDQEKRLFAARDRLGIKPFHYWVNPGQTQLAFASELKALLGFLPARRVNVRLAREFLAWNLLDHDPAETMLQDIFRLPAGHYLTWERQKGINLRRYWTFEVSEELQSSAKDRARLISEFREQFRESVSLHLRSDVPVGSCLSGGLDSSSIVCAVTAELKARGAWKANWQHTFSACFEDPSLDERSYIDSVTQATQSHNHQVFPSGERLAEEMDTWLWHQEEPVGGSGVYAQYCVARLAREQGIKVLLDGQGADEQLAGYRKFILVYLRQLWSAGHFLRSAREATAFFSSWDILKTSTLADGKRYLRQSVPETASLWAGQPHPLRPAAFGLDTSLGRRLQADMSTFSLPLLLRFEDRNTMAFGVESRVPFVDHVLLEWVTKLPADLRLMHGWTKSILREALADLLPPMVRSRKSKLGFSTPESKWLRGPLRPWLTRTLARPTHLGAVVDPAGVAELLDLHERNKLSGTTEALLFRLAAYENWARLFLEERKTAKVSEVRAMEELIVTILPMTEEMLPAVCSLHLNAFAGVMSVRLGSRYVRAFISWFVKTKDAVALVAATERGDVVGYVIGAPVGYTKVLNRELAWVAATSMIARPWLLFDLRIRATLMARLGFMFGSPAADTSGLPSPAMALVGIAVAPSRPAKGIGYALMKGFEERARALKMASLRLSVYPDNSAARRLYERCGWHALPQPPSTSGTIYYGRVSQ